MKRFSVLFLIVSVLALFFVAAPPAHADGFAAKDFTLTLTGQGYSSKDFDTGAFSFNVAPSYFVSHNVEVGVRQSLIISDGGSDWSGSTAAFLDVNFTLIESLPKLVTFVGFSGGYAYGGAVDDHWFIGPEGGLKYFLTDDAYLYGIVQYQFDASESFGDGAFTYGIGIGVRL